LQSVAEHGSSRINQEHKLIELLELCQTAIKTDYSNRDKDVVYFLTDYCNTADEYVSHAII